MRNATPDSIPAGKIPESAARYFIDPGIMKPRHRGKVRDSYILDGNKLLQIATDRVSCYDVVLPPEIDAKGQVLTGLHVYWSQRLKGILPTDLLAYGADIDRFLPENLRGDRELQKRTIVVQQMRMIPRESICRGFLNGSAWRDYLDSAPNHNVCGIPLPAGMHEGDKLEPALWTPSTKSADDHDKNISAAQTEKRFPGLKEASIQLYTAARNIAEGSDIIIVDTKLELGHDAEGILTLGDEIFTPDSSRFWRKEDYELFLTTGRKPPSYDKQFLRDWLATQGIDEKINPKSPQDLARVRALKIPQQILDRTARIYHEIFALLTGMDLETFQTEEMGIKPRRRCATGGLATV